MGGIPWRRHALVLDVGWQGLGMDVGIEGFDFGNLRSRGILRMAMDVGRRDDEEDREMGQDELVGIDAGPWRLWLPYPRLDGSVS
jgi:hypothetical protein